jgi:thiosulfate/3-mercaptopyruvate sulfurtransferase
MNMANLITAAPELARMPHALVLDLRDREDYDDGHWPGAVHLDVKRWERLARTAEGSLEHAGVWADEIGRLGIDGCRPVVVLDDGRMTEAARAWFILQWRGVDARVLDGGWRALCALPGFVAERAPGYPAPVRYQPPANHVPRVHLVQRDRLREQLNAAWQVLDARTRAEHVGEDLRANARGGHLPGARSLPHAELLNADGTLKSAPELRERLTAAGLDDDRPVVTHCDAGGRAALAALAAAVAGHREVHAYYLSFSDWAADGTCPVVKP